MKKGQKLLLSIVINLSSLYYVYYIVYLQQITGAGHGIGKELAIQYAQLGATVVCLDVNQQSNDKTTNEIKEMAKSSVYAYQ